jgi:GNAT superfamily N-acetyltransferase
MNDTFQFRLETLGATKHRRSDFRCESQELTDYLRQQAHKEMAARTSVCFVLVPVPDPGRIAGYYTMSAASVALAKMPVELSRRLPNYPAVPATWLGRLACDLEFKGQGVGRLLMRDALQRAWAHSGEIGSVAIVTDPKDAKAAGFYGQFGFQRLDERRMLVGMEEVGRWLEEVTNG